MRPLQAIYPTIIILLVAMRRSPIDRSVSQMNGEQHAANGAGTSSTLIFGRSVVGSTATQHTVNATVDLAYPCVSESSVQDGLDSSGLEKGDAVCEV